MKHTSLLSTLFAAVSLPAATFTVVDVVTDDFEYGQNSEPSIAVNPSDPRQAFLTAFDEFSRPSPIFFTGDGGATWSLFTRATTFDASLAWPAGGAPYLAHLNGENITSVVVRKATPPFGATGAFAVLPGASYLPADVPDQPWIAAARVAGADRLYVGINDLSQRSGKTATVYFSLDGGTLWRRTVLERIRPRLGQNGPPVRVAVVGDTVYAAFQTGDAFVRGDVLGDVVVVKDTAGGTNNFGNLGAGAIAAESRVFPQGSLGQERIGSDLSLAVDPSNPNNVYVALAVTDADGSPVVQVVASKDGGATWVQVYETRARAALPAIAVAGNGTVGLLYTAYLYRKLETHLAQTTNDFQNVSDDVLSRFVDAALLPDFDPFIGDYEMLVAVGATFHGAFSASNDASLYPQQPVFLRDTAMLGTRVPFSIDPFYFTAPAITAPPIPAPGPAANDDDLIFGKVEDAFAFVALNDVDPAGDVLSVKTVGKPAHGSAIKAGTGSVVYTPGKDFTGADTFTYTVVNSIGQTATAAVHVSNPFFALSGAFVGLVTNSLADAATRGVLNITLTHEGGFTGTLHLAGARFTFRGEFALDGSAVAVIQRPLGPITLILSLDLGSGLVSGTISDGIFFSSVAARRAVYPRGVVSAQTGYYTFGLLHDAADTLDSVPHGDGYGTVTVASAGLLRAAGALADGTKFSQGITLPNAGVWPLYVLLYGGKGSLSGEAAFSPQPGSDVSSGAVAWIKPPAPKDARYKAGFATTLALTGSKYIRPGVAGPRVILAPQGLGRAHFEGGDLAAAFDADFQLSLAGKFTAELPNTARLLFALNTSSGIFSGSVRPSPAAAAIVFSGAIVTKANAGFGYFLGKTTGGRVSLTARP